MLDEMKEASNAAPTLAATPTPVERESLWTKVALIFIGAVVASAVTLFFTTYEGRLRRITYTVQRSEGIINKPDVGESTIAILLDERPVENLSTIRIGVTNTSGRDYKDLPLLITFQPMNAQTPQFAQKPLSESRDIASFEQKTQPDGSLLLTYTLKVFNRSDTFEPEFLFEGVDTPDVSLEVQMAGLEASQTEALAGVAGVDLAMLVFYGCTFASGMLIATAFLVGRGMSRKGEAIKLAAQRAAEELKVMRGEFERQREEDRKIKEAMSQKSSWLPPGFFEAFPHLAATTEQIKLMSDKLQKP